MINIKYNPEPTTTKRFIAILREASRLDLQFEVTDSEIRIPLKQFEWEPVEEEEPNKPTNE